MWSELGQDFSLYHRLRHPARRMTLLGKLRIMASGGLWQLAVHRASHEIAVRANSSSGRTLRSRLWGFVLLPVGLLMKVMTKNEIHESSVLEGGIYVSNRGGIVLGARRIGSGTLIHHNVTIGMNPYDRGRPDIGRRVWIGHDSFIYGAISIGDGVTILPGSVLAKSIPPRAVVMGNPARVVMRGFDNRVLCSSGGDARISLPEPQSRRPPVWHPGEMVADVR